MTQNSELSEYDQKLVDHMHRLYPWLALEEKVQEIRKIQQANQEQIMQLQKEPTYRTPAAKPPKELYVRTLDEAIFETRQRIPGPLRRLLALITYVPVYVCSILFAGILAPLSWILHGDACTMLDRRIRYTDRGNRKWRTEPLVRGTSALYFDFDRDDLDFIRKEAKLPKYKPPTER